MYGLTRQTTVNAESLEFVPEFSFTEAGIHFNIENTAETGYGFALVNDGTNAGLLVYSDFVSTTSEHPSITLTVPGGKITSVKLCMTAERNNGGLNALSVQFNSEEVDSEKDGNLYYWNWKNAEGVETVVFGWNNQYFMRFIRSITLVYTEDLGGKEECGLSFSETSATAFIGETFTPPVLNNPNGLPLTWSSSSEDVATVDENGNVTPVAPGKTTITVATPGLGNFAAGNTSYSLKVIPTASNIPQLSEYAPEMYDMVKVNFPMIVTFPNNSYAFVIDEEGNATYIFDTRNKESTSTVATTIYKVGDVIPAGWIATNATLYSNVIWEGLPDKVEETVEVVYPIVTSVTPADVDRVVILRDVTFETSTPFDNSNAYGKTPDGTTYEFQNTLGITSNPAGTYDVTCAVRYTKVGNKEYFYLMPIKYEDNIYVMIDGIEEESSAVRYFDLNGTEVSTPNGNIYIKVANGKAVKVIVK